MSNIPEELQYTGTHEWVRKEEDGSVTVGVTDHGQCMLGDLVFVELPEEDIELDKDQECCVLESVKAAADIYSPLAGVVTEVNEALTGTPDIVNRSPYDEGWLYRMMPVDERDLTKLLDAAAYRNCIKAEAH